jgi:hypothetical protein
MNEEVPAVDETTEEVPDELRQLAELSNTVPVEFLAATQSKYGPMDFEAEGSWTPTYEGNTLVGVAWTDWTSGAGFVSAIADDTTYALRMYFVTAKDLGISPSIAYTTFSTYLENHFKGVTVKDSETGILQGVIGAVSSEVKN